MTYSRAWLAAPVCIFAAAAAAQPVLIQSPAVLNPGETTIVDQSTGTAVPLATAEITVRGTTLTVNGRHRIRSLRLEGPTGLTSGSASGCAASTTSHFCSVTTGYRVRFTPAS